MKRVELPEGTTILIPVEGTPRVWTHKPLVSEVFPDKRYPKLYSLALQKDGEPVGMVLAPAKVKGVRRPPNPRARAAVVHMTNAHVVFHGPVLIRCEKGSTAAELLANVL